MDIFESYFDGDDDDNEGNDSNNQTPKPLPYQLEVEQDTHEAIMKYMGLIYDYLEQKDQISDSLRKSDFLKEYGLDKLPEISKDERRITIDDIVFSGLVFLRLSAVMPFNTTLEQLTAAARLIIRDNGKNL